MYVHGSAIDRDKYFFYLQCTTYSACVYESKWSVGTDYVISSAIKGRDERLQVYV